MKILLTGSAGLIGTALTPILRDAGYSLRTFDTEGTTGAEGIEHQTGDLRDFAVVKKAMDGMDAVIHAGAIAYDRPNADEKVLDVNVHGTLNVLVAATQTSAKRIISFSSINALGCVGGQTLADGRTNRPVEFPITDNYPRHPMSPYQLSKHLGEEACRTYTARYGLTTLSLRPGYVAKPEVYTSWRNDPTEEKRAQNQAAELWAYVDLRDVCEAVKLSLTLEGVKNDAFLLFADDTTLAIPTADLLARFFPDIPWIADKEAYFAHNPFRSPMDNSHAREVLGWTPKHSWRNEK
jgi:UDP-glucose 4-epimerase